MDLIYTDEKRKDTGVLDDYVLDLAYGADENNFECTVDLEKGVCPISSALYIEGTEYGGIIDGLRVDTESRKLVYLGRTWHGVLDGHILEPDSGQDYLILNGDANVVIGQIIKRCGLADLFQAINDLSGIRISNYKMNRYIGAYTGIKKALAEYGGKLSMRYSGKDKRVLIYAIPVIDYSQDEEFDSSQFDFVVQKQSRPANHVICLGRGDLKDREVVHLYCDEAGNISKQQTQYGENEVAIVYDYSNAESTEELEEGGAEELMNAWEEAESVDIDFQNKGNYDIGDIVGAREEHTGVFVSRPVTKKIVKINKEGIRVECQIGE